jgi:hypothetical protein
MSTRIARRLVLCAILAAGIGVTGVVLQAHHAVAGVYDLSKEIVLEGKLKPHAGIVLTVADKKVKGKLVDWTLTTASVTSLTLQGFGKNTIKPGDPLKVTILPAVNGNPAGYIRRISLGDKDFKFDVE